MPKITLATDKSVIKSNQNPEGRWTLKELIIFSIVTGTRVLFKDLRICIDKGELRKI